MFGNKYCIATLNLDIYSMKLNNFKGKVLEISNRNVQLYYFVWSLLTNDSKLLLFLFKLDENNIFLIKIWILLIVTKSTL